MQYQILGHHSLLLLLKFGGLPIELAAEYGTWEDVEILFPFTSPISTATNWRIDGIASHVKMEINHLEQIKALLENVGSSMRPDHCD